MEKTNLIETKIASMRHTEIGPAVQRSIFSAKYLSEKDLLSSSLIELQEVLRQRYRISDVLRKIRQETNQGRLYDEILSSVFESLRLVIPFDRLGIALLEDDKKTLRSKWVKSILPVTHLKCQYAGKIEGSSLETLFQTGKPRIIPDLEKYSKEHPNSVSTQLILKDGIRSSLTFPLISEKEPLGVVFFSSARPLTYQEEHIEIFAEIAEEITLLIQHGKLRKYFSEKRSQDAMMSMVIHDLRSPIGIIKGYLDLLNDEAWFQQLGDTAHEIFAALERNSNAMLDLISDLSEVKQIDEEHSSIYPERVDLYPFLSQFTRESSVYAQNKKIAFAGSFHLDNLSEANFDPARIRRVLQNLTSNAIKFSKPKTQIKFEVRARDGRLFFGISDQGQGIAQDEIPKLFKWFSKTSTRPTAHESSTGLGLFICKKIVEAHGGEISVISEVDKGSTFTFWIPL